jgi:predicted dehydrogenase
MNSTMNRIVVAVVGLGNWGRNHVRALAGLRDCRVKYVYDLDAEAIEAQREIYPAIEAARDFDQVVGDEEIQALVISTSSNAHFDLARRALEAGKDVFVEKPMASTVEECETLISLAEHRRCVLQVGHLMLFHPAVQYLKELIDRGGLGEVYYVYCQRLNLGVVRSDENSLWSLAPHDLSLANYLLGAAPSAVHATGGCYLQKGIEDVIFVTLTYPGGRIAHIHVSWLDPHKIRRVTIVGSEKMAMFDDMEATEKVRIYDKGVQRPQYENYGEALSIRMGDIYIPNIPNTEPLKVQAQHFLACVRERRRPLADGREGLAVVRALTEATRGLNSVS